MYGNLVEMSKNDYYTTEDLSDYSYHQNCYQLNSTDLFEQKSTSILQRVNFIRKLDKDDGVTMLFIAEKRQKL